MHLKNCSHPNNTSHYEFMIRSECWAESFTGHLNIWMWFWRKPNHRHNSAIVILSVTWTMVETEGQQAFKSCLAPRLNFISLLILHSWLKNCKTIVCAAKFSNSVFCETYKSCKQYQNTVWIVKMKWALEHDQMSSHSTETWYAITYSVWKIQILK